jgi:hypothetical protein
MPVNANPEYVEAEKEYHQAQTLNEKLEKLKKNDSSCSKT